MCLSANNYLLFSVVVREDKKLLTVLFPDGRDGRAFTLKVLLLLYLSVIGPPNHIRTLFYIRKCPQKLKTVMCLRSDPVASRIGLSLYLSICLSFL